MTMLEQLAAAFPEQIERIKACATVSLDTDCSSTASEALSEAFVWSETNEGDAYWRALYESAATKS